MKRFILFILKRSFGTRSFSKFYSVLKNISFRGLNYRNTNIDTNGERFFIRYIDNFYKGNPTPINLFDIGANVGNYSIGLDESVTADRRIYSFEPFSKVFVELDKLKEKIKSFYPFQIGFSDKVQTQKFLSSSVFSEVGGLYNKDFTPFGFTLDLSEEVHFETVDNFCQERDISHIHLLKVDVEGHDLFVLNGARKMLSENKIDFIQFEFGAANYLSKTYLFDFFQLLSPNYRVFKLLKNGFMEIKEYNTDIEIHILSNYIAINKSLNAGLIKLTGNNL